MTVENWLRDSTRNDQARLIIYHGVGEAEATKLRYSAGVMVLPKEHPRTIRYRSAHPILTSDLPRERRPISDGYRPARRSWLPHRFDIYYGMADDRIGAACLEAPDFLPPEGLADTPEQGYRVTV